MYATHADGFESPARDRVSKQRSELDPLSATPTTNDAFEKFNGMADDQLEKLIAILTVELLTHGNHQSNTLVLKLAEAMDVKLREHWTPDAAWFKSYRKVQLVELLGKLEGANNAQSSDAKHADLVNRLSTLFVSAAEGTLADKKLAEKVNRWRPAPLDFEKKPKRGA